MPFSLGEIDMRKGCYISLFVGRFFSCTNGECYLYHVVSLRYYAVFCIFLIQNSLTCNVFLDRITVFLCNVHISLLVGQVLMGL